MSTSDSGEFGRRVAMIRVNSFASVLTSLTIRVASRASLEAASTSR